MISRGVCKRMLNLRMTKEGSSGKEATAANRTREIRLSGMRGWLAETWATEEIETQRTTERVRIGLSLPKVYTPYFYSTIRMHGLVEEVTLKKRNLLRSMGFTLLELLIVVGITMILMSLLLPAINKSQEQAKVINCAGTLKTIGLACMMYAHDNSSFLPLPSAGANGTYITDSNARMMQSFPVLLYNSGTLGNIQLTSGTGAVALQNREKALRNYFKCPGDLHNYKYDSSGVGNLTVSYRAQLFLNDAKGSIGMSNYAQRGKIDRDPPKLCYYFDIAPTTYGTILQGGTLVFNHTGVVNALNIGGSVKRIPVSILITQSSAWNPNMNLFDNF